MGYSKKHGENVTPMAYYITQHPWTPHIKRVGITTIAESRSPGPAYVSLPPTYGYDKHDPTRHRGPAYTFGERYWTDMRANDSPGPAAYNVEYMSRYGKHRIPTAHVTGWSQNALIAGGPGPGAYNPESCFDFTRPTAPKHSFGNRVKESQLTGGPAPTAYNIPDLLCKSYDSKYPTAPRAYLMSRRPDPGMSNDAPGPGAYKIVNADVYKNRAPQHSLAFRRDHYADYGCAPGPGAYRPERVNSATSSHSN